MGSKRKRQAQDAPSVAPATKKQHKASKPTTTDLSTPPPQPTLFVADPEGAELKREVTLYEQLSSHDPSERLQAADAIVSGLLGSDGVSEPTLQRHLERRLFRGLASGRKGARLGFSIALTEILRQLFGERNLAGERYTAFSFEKVLGMLKAKTKPEGDLSGQEERDHALGLLFGLQCFVRAGVLFEDGNGDERWEEVSHALLHLCKKKPWMREECGWIFVEALGYMKQLQAETTLAKLQEAGLAASPEGAGIWITARRKFPDIKFPSKPWGHNGNPLENLKTLAKALKESSSSEDNEKGEKIKQTGSWNPQLHFVWRIVMDEYIEKAKMGDAVDFINFWKTVVDENLFSSSASSERKFWGFLLFQKILNDGAVYPTILEGLFSQNLMRCLINHVSNEDRFLHRAAEKSLKSIQQTIEAHPSTAAPIISGLVSGHGVYNFDQVTKTKTIEKIFSHVQAEYRENVFRALLSPILTMMPATGKDAEVHRQMFGDYALSMIRQINIADAPKNIAWVKSACLPSLASLAYSQGVRLEPALTEKSRILFRNRLNSALAHLISAPEFLTLPCDLVQQVDPNAIDMDKDIVATKDRALAIIEKLMKKAKKINEQDRKPLQALALLHALVIFQLYNGESDAVSLLEELKLCYDKLSRVKDTDGLDAEASVVLVEILLSLMSKPSVLLRKIAQHVFMAFSSEITGESLKILLDVLESSESLKGQQELFDHDNEEDEEDEDNDELDSDVEIVEIDGAAEDEDEDTDLDDEAEEDEDEEENDEDAQKLDEALAEALGTHRADEDLKAESSDSDADMSDSEMMALDSKLVEIFSQRRKQPNKKQEKKDARENIINFKSRTLDLLEIYVKEQAASPLAFKLLVPMLKLIRTTTAKHLSEKAHKVITAFAKASKGLKSGESSTQIATSERLQTMKDVHTEASKDASHAFAKAASTASLLVATNLYRASKGNVKKIATVYRDTQIAWLEGERRIQASFFHDWVNWCQSYAAVAAAAT